MAVSIWCPNPDEVVYRLRQSTKVKYPKNVKNVNFGYSHIMVVPTLYDYVISAGDVPEVETTCIYLWNLRERDPKREEEARQRTFKLVLDFYRELHTFGLLATHGAFGLVSYAAATDVDLGIDYLGRLSRVRFHLAQPGEVGIQSAIGGRESRLGGRYQVLKAARKVGRGAHTWTGPLYWLTNETRPAMIERQTGTWLFTREHVADLIDSITGNVPDVGVQTRLID